MSPRILVLALVFAVPSLALATAPGDDPDTWEEAGLAGVLGWDEAGFNDILWSATSGNLGPSDLADWYAWDVRAGDAVWLMLTWFFAPEDGVLEIRDGDGALLAQISTDDPFSSAVRREWRGAPEGRIYVGVLSPSGWDDRFGIDLAAGADLDFAVTDVRFTPALDTPGRVLVDVAIPADSAQVARELRIETPVSNIELASVLVTGSGSGGVSTYAVDLQAPLHEVRAQLTPYEFDGHPENDQRLGRLLG